MIDAHVLPGLPSTGPMADHLHMASGTPWSEGHVIRFSDDATSDLTVNFQNGNGYATKNISWNDTDKFVIIAKGASYFIHISNRERSCFVCDFGIDCRITPDAKNAFIATYHDVLMISLTGDTCWRTHLAVDGIEFEDVGNDTIRCQIRMDPPDDWRAVSLSRANGEHG